MYKSNYYRRDTIIIPKTVLKSELERLVDVFHLNKQYNATRAQLEHILTKFYTGGAVDSDLNFCKPCRWLLADFTKDPFILNFLIILTQSYYLKSLDKKWNIDSMYHNALLQHVDDTTIDYKMIVLESMAPKLLYRMFIIHFESFRIYWKNSWGGTLEMLRMLTPLYSYHKKIENANDWFMANMCRRIYDIGFMQNNELHNLLPRKIQVKIPNLQNTSLSELVKQPLSQWIRSFEILHESFLPRFRIVKFGNISDINITNTVNTIVFDAKENTDKFLFIDLGELKSIEERPHSDTIIGLCMWSGKKYIYKKFLHALLDNDCVLKRQTLELEIAASERACHSHENLVPILGNVSKNGACYLIMEYLTGEMIHRHMINESRDFLILHMAHIIATINVMACHGVVHNDLHPNNIIMEKTTKKFITYNVGVFPNGIKRTCSIPTLGFHPRLIDFGMSHVEGFSNVMNKKYDTGYELTGITCGLSPKLMLILTFYRLYMPNIYPNSKTQHVDYMSSIILNMYILLVIIEEYAYTTKIITSTMDLKKYVIGCYNNIETRGMVYKYRTCMDWYNLCIF